MSTASTASLVDTLRQHRLLDPKQLEELTSLQARFPDPKALAKELIQRGWLSPYQANQLLNGKGQELVLGQYILLERLGEGGMGQVFKARHRMLGRISAIKLIRKERLESPDAVRRFQREVRSAAALSHPNIVRAYDADEIAGTHLMVMEYIEGAIDLAKLVKKNGPLPVQQACEYIRQAALGLQHAHEKGMVHRDIKPANLILTDRGKTVKILDMGLARLDHPGADDDDKSSTMTQEGTVMGTPDYIAPEQALDTHTVDIRADLYSLGCAFYYLLTGRVPFPGGTLIQKINKHQFEEPMPIEKVRPEVPPEVAKVVRKLMAKKPVDRYQTPAEVATALAGVSGQSSGFAVPAIANALTIADAEQAEAAKEVGRDTLASAFSYIGKRDDTVAFEAGPPVQEKPRNRRWLLVGAAVGSCFFVGLVVMLFLVFRGSADKKPPEAKKEDPPKKEEGPPKTFTNPLGMKFAWIPPGNFMMGSPTEEIGREANEAQHKVTLTKGFYIGVNTVTQEQYETVIGKNPSGFKGEKNLPVETVSWDDCQEFVKKLREKDKKAYRLPTEAEWEYACRAGTTTPFHYGETISTDQANYNGEPYGNGKKGVARGKTTPVGSFPANAFGLYDMHGNVWVWCQDWSGEYPQKDVVAPQGPGKGQDRVLRGGSWHYIPVYCRSAFRFGNVPGSRNFNFGFRLCFCLD
jgi:formylglycine-generating enzyme required for sulfatase activity/tRNA A-37 threonylcarbamoyl transferase component Bud32